MEITLDSSDYCLIDAYQQFRNPQLLRDYVLGFETDHRISNFDVLQGDYSYVSNHIDSKHIPGLMLKEQQEYLIRQQCDISNRRLAFKVYTPSGMIHVYPSTIYNGSDIVVNAIYSNDSRISDIRYIDIVLMLYKHITGTCLGTLSYKYESEKTLAAIPYINYIPNTSSYMSMLNLIADASSCDAPVYINRKYDGQAVWLYISSTVPPSLLYQVKVKKGVVHKYIGRVFGSCDVTLDGYYCMLMERIIIYGQINYVITDSYSHVPEEYICRLSRAKNVLRRYSYPNSLYIEYGFTLPTRLVVGVRTFDGSINTHGNLSSVVDYVHYTKHDIVISNGHECVRVTPHGSNDSYEYPVQSLVTIMQEMSPGTDGYVVYIGDSRPTKVKLASMMTIDVMYDKSTMSWDCSDDIQRRLENPSEDIVMSTNDNLVVVEMNLHTGKPVRIRADRTRGNSRMVMDRLIRSYDSDVNYSLIDVWSGRNIKFSIAINRCFKRYMHARYMPRGCNLLDAGSGNGGDMDIWEDMGYKVLAVEKDKDRYKILANRSSNNNNIRSINEDMRNMINYLGTSIVRYHCASFMRSIGTLTSYELQAMFTGLRLYGCKKLLIVVMISDGLISHSYTYSDKNFSIIYDDHEAVTVRYNTDDEVIEYTDNCYSLSKWLDVCLASGYNVVVEKQSDFMDRTYSLKPSDSIYQCFTDVGLYLHAD